MIPNLDLIRTMLEGIRESVFARLKCSAEGLERKISAVEKRIHTPDYAAAEGQNGYIKNKPVPTGRAGTGEAAEIFNNYEENVASGLYAHAEGSGTTASGDYGSHAEGTGTTASGRWGSHAEGFNTVASGSRSHAEGSGTTASSIDAHAEGYGTKAASQNQHVQGKYNAEDTDGVYAHIVGNGTADNARSNAHTLDWEGNAWFAGEVLVGGTGQDDAGAKPLLKAEEAQKTYAPIAAPAFTGSVSMGRKAGESVGANSAAMGRNVTAGGAYAHAEGDNTTASGEGAHAEGYGTAASNTYAHAEGRETTSGAQAAHAEGMSTAAGGTAAHAEGRSTSASGSCAHAEGQGCQATESWCHAEGYNSVASGSISHAEGNRCTAKGYSSHAEGQGTVAASDYQHVQGRYNVEDEAFKYLHIVGNGTATQNEAGETVEVRSNAHTLDWAGNAWFAGSLEGTALILKSSGGKYFRLTVNDSGALQAAELLR